MITTTAAEVRPAWSDYNAHIFKGTPLLVKSPREEFSLSSLDQLDTILNGYTYSAEMFREEDGYITLALKEIALVECEKDEKTVRIALGKGILDYAGDYFAEFDYWYRGNARSHLPYVLKALLINDAKAIGDLLICRPGSN